MTFPILGANSAVGGYTIDNSLRFNDDDSAYLSRTPGSAGNRRTFTLSVWFKLTVFAGGDANYERQILSADDGTGGNNNFDYIAINNSGQIFIYGYEGAENQQLKSTQLLRDASAWYHLVVAFDTTQATASNRIKVYLNGNQVTAFATANYPSLNFQTRINNTNPHYIGKYPDSNTQYFDGYMAEYHLIDGQQLDASSFGEFDEDSGVWKPKQYAGTYGTNGFYLKFNNTGNMGEDSSGNDNTWTPTNLSGPVDVTTDTPTNNFATILPMANTSLSEGNLKLTTSRTGYWDGTIGTFGVKSGKWYHEVRMSNTEENFRCVAGWIGNEASQTVVLNGKGVTGDPVTSLFYNYAFLPWASFYYKDGTYYGTSPTATSGDIINIAVDFDNGKLWFGINGTYYNNSGSATGNPSAGTNESISGIGLTASEYVPFFQIRSDSSIGGNIMIPNFGQEGSFAGTETAQGNADGNGYGDFYYAPPTGFLALCTQNLATALSPTIDDGSQYFNTVLYSGNSSTQSITGVGFQPDFVWLKSRTNTASHRLNDSSRGVNKQLASNAPDAETTFTTMLTSFDSDGFTLGDNVGINGTGFTNVGWSWKANAGSTSSNTDGSITSTVQANTTAGFSIVTFTGTGSVATVGHGLGKAPAMMIFKNRDAGGNYWRVYHQSLGATKNLVLNGTFAQLTETAKFNNTEPTSNVFTVGTDNDTNASSQNILSYCFAEIEGYSKFDRYIGNGSTDGTFIYTGFRPAFIMVKRTDSTGYWLMFDSARQPENENDSWLLANDTSNEGINSTGMDFISNGFKLRNSSTAAVHNNISGGTYIYMAFAENPFVTSGNVPVTAR